MLSSQQRAVLASKLVERCCSGHASLGAPSDVRQALLRRRRLNKPLPELSKLHSKVCAALGRDAEAAALSPLEWSWLQRALEGGADDDVPPQAQWVQQVAVLVPDASAEWQKVQHLFKEGPSSQDARAVSTLLGWPAAEPSVPGAAPPASRKHGRSPSPAGGDALHPEALAEGLSALSMTTEVDEGSRQLINEVRQRMEQQQGAGGVDDAAAG
jgi:hypothetical protein